MANRSNLLSATFSINGNSVKAIAVRDMMARYGRNNLGFLWSLIEPMILAVGVMVLWSFMKAPFEHGVAILAIVFSGYLPLTLWRHISMPGAGLFVRGGHYLFHRNISLLDIFLARALSEFSFTTAGALIIYAALRSLDLMDPIERWDLVIGGWMIMGLLASCFMLLFACLTVLSEDLDKFHSAFQYIMLPISGCFFMLAWVPESSRELFLMLPMTHCYEMIRDGMFGRSIDTFYYPVYPIVFSLVVLLVSLQLLPQIRERLHGQ